MAFTNEFDEVLCDDCGTKSGYQDLKKVEGEVKGDDVMCLDCGKYVTEQGGVPTHEEGAHKEDDK